MKKLAVILLVTLGVTAHAQTLSVGVGTTLNGMDGVSANIIERTGYYVGVTSNGRLTDYFAYSGSVQFMDQRMESEGYNFNAYSVNAAFYYKWYPAKERFALLAGAQMGYITAVTIDGEHLEDYDLAKIYATVGATYEINRFEIIARPLFQLNDEKLFDWTVQIGANYRINGN